MKKDMQKIMYLCPVDWRWIKQRPQFLAEELSHFFDIHAVYPYKNNRRGLQNKGNTHIELIPCFSLPTFGGKLPFVGRINSVLSKLQMMMAYRKIKPDVLWVSMPWQIDCFAEHLQYRLVYDCMDDYAAITANMTGINELIEQEKKIVRRADIIFASSENLRHVLADRHQIEVDNIHLLRNGYNANWLQEDDKAVEDKKADEQVFRIGYFGTIGRWFDFELLLKSLEQFPQVEYDLFGPLEAGVQIPQHKRLLWRGVLEHDTIKEQAKQLDALIMPFLLNDIVRSVDPVKLYEYVWMGKDILCIRYPEIERFEPFVFFYQTQEEYMEHLETVIKKEKPKYSHEQAMCFLAENNWGKRAEKAAELIHKIANGGGNRS